MCRQCPRVYARASETERRSTSASCSAGGRVPRGSRRPVAEQLAEWRSDRERGPLQDCGREGQADGVEVRLCDHREPKGVRETLAVRLALGGQGEHRLDQRLELECGPSLGEEASCDLARVPETVRGGRRNRDDRAGLCDELGAVDLQAEAPLEDLEALGLEG